MDNNKYHQNIVDEILDNEFANDHTYKTFECLKIYFENLTLQQLINIKDNEKWLNMVEYKHRIIMLVFVNEYLQNYLNKYSS